MTTNRIRTAEERRHDIRSTAASLGIDEAYINCLVDEFYLRVRSHPLLGPVFEAAIDDWEPHLETMKMFWSSVALNSGVYSGKPVPAHKKLTSVQPWHFGIWLGLFEATLNDTAPSSGAAAYFMERAERIAKSLQLAMFGVPGIPPARSPA